MPAGKLTQVSPPTSDDEEDPLLREQQQVRDYLRDNQPPTYLELETEMLSHQGQPWWHNVQAWMCEFGVWNYDKCIEIRANILDRDVCKAIGQEIHDRGGFTAMQANYYIMKNFLMKV